MGLESCRNGRADDRLESLKQRAAYLNSTVRTVHRWKRDEGYQPAAKLVLAELPFENFGGGSADPMRALRKFAIIIS
jgi:hypothetical protein